MWIQISSGKGPAECELAVGFFLKILFEECNEKKIEAELTDSVAGIHPGTFQSVLLSLSGPKLEEFTNSIYGTVLWICKSPYRPHHKRKNWFIDVEVFEEPTVSLFLEKDIQFETLRSSGPGGQNINKVETAVRAIHGPSGITVVASEERTQYVNKKLALARLAKIVEHENQIQNQRLRKSMRDQHNHLERGNPVRIYEGEEFRRKTTLRA